MPLAPVAIGGGFLGIVDDLTAIPPDTMGAVGPNHLVSFLNTEVGFFDKTGNKTNPMTTLQAFWLPLITSKSLPNDPQNPPFDPKVLFDQHSGRFVAMTLDGQPPEKSWVLLARSNSSDPGQGWSQWAIPADNNLWADYPGLGVDANNIYLTTNMFDNGSLQDPTPSFHFIKVWVVPKAGLVAGQDPQNVTAMENPFNFTGPLDGGPFSFQPSHVFGTPGDAYIVGEQYPAGSALRVGKIYPLPFVDLGTVGVSSYPATYTLPVAPFDRIDTGDSRIQNVVYRNGHLFTTHSVPNPTSTKTIVRWYELSTAPLSRIQEGTISDPNRFYYYPSLAVNSTGDVAIGFSGSSSSPAEYAGAYYTARRAADPAGVMQPVTLLKSGQASYYKDFGYGSNRWGDFSATVVDPADDTTFWTLQEIAYTSVWNPHDNAFVSRWATWWGSWSPPAIAPPTNLAASQQPSSQILLTWSNPEAGTDNIIVERRTAPAGDFASIATLPSSATTYSDGSGVSAGTTYFYRVRVGNAGGRSYSNETYVSAVGSTPPPSTGGGGGGGCLSITRSAGQVPFGTSLFSVGILLLPACALGLRRFSRRQERTVPIRHPLC
ncbi:MAG: fibronectin type III domain-containing protein [Candidatus Deferrimicrobium sp.]|nr:fibronectin type III domain-containing protein [Candidatus Deferrimicrobium sp.]